MNKIHKLSMDQRNNFSPRPLHIQLLSKHLPLNFCSTTPAQTSFPLQRSALRIQIMIFSKGFPLTGSMGCHPTLNALHSHQSLLVTYCAGQPTHVLKTYFWQVIISSPISEKVNQCMVRNIPSWFLLSCSFVWRKRDMLKDRLSCTPEKLTN